MGFASPLDTFIEGLHRRTRDLHEESLRKQSRTREEAVNEMLLRLRWNDDCIQSRNKLSQIVGRIWDGLEGVKSSDGPVSSALWLIDDEEEDWIEVREHAGK